MSATPLDVDWTEVATTGIVLPIMTDGELLGGYIDLPYDLDPKFPIGFRVKYLLDHDGSGVATAEWILLVGAKKEGIAIATAATALDTPIPVHTYFGPQGAATVADLIPNVTAGGILLPETHLFTHDDVVTMRAGITISLECQAIVNETSLSFMSLLMDYMPQRCSGGGSETDGPLRYDEKA